MTDNQKQPIYAADGAHRHLYNALLEVKRRGKYPDCAAYHGNRVSCAVEQSRWFEELAVPGHLNTVEEQYEGDEPVKDAILLAAKFHDALEDLNANAHPMLVAASRHPLTVQLVEALTKQDGDDYFEDYIPRIMAEPTGYAVRIKYYDILDNLGSEPTVKQIRKYARALEMIAPMVGVE